MKKMSFILLFLFASLKVNAAEYLSREQLIAALNNNEIIRHGNFTLKSGQQSTTYIDMRQTMSHPLIFSSLGMQLKQLIVPLSFDLICGVPYGAVPVATMVALLSKKPLILCRKEVKGHGTKNLIEGKWAVGNTVLLIEDVITTGASIFETIMQLEQNGLCVNHVVVLIDRQQGGVDLLQSRGYNVHVLFKIDDLM